MSQNLPNMLENTIQKIREMVDSNSVVGEAITTPDGVTIIPISKISIGLGGGGSDFVSKNLNRQEIFGMAILEAMYYGCKVVAWHAPGPDFIIEDGVSGCLVNDDRELINKVFDEQDFSQSAHRRICDKFTWESTARTIAGTVEK